MWLTLIYSVSGVLGLAAVAAALLGHGAARAERNERSKKGEVLFDYALVLVPRDGVREGQSAAYLRGPRSLEFRKALLMAGSDRADVEKTIDVLQAWAVAELEKPRLATT
jgi:hypothetical protein